MTSVKYHSLKKKNHTFLIFQLYACFFCLGLIVDGVAVRLDEIYFIKRENYCRSFFLLVW